MFDEGQQFVKAALGIDGNVFPIFVDDAVRQEEDLHAQGMGHHVLAHIVAHHQALCGVNPQGADHIPVVAGVGFAAAGIFVDGISA